MERLIRLQKIDAAADDARRKIADHPHRSQVLDEQLAAARDAVAGVKTRQADALANRRAEEKEVAAVQARLAKYKDQLLEVKTNREYQAMLHEIEAAQTDVRAREDRILESMMAADELGAELKKVEADLKAVEQAAEVERRTLAEEKAALQAEIDKAAAARTGLAAEISAPALDTFERVARARKGLAVAEAKDGMCTICHVRLRPQVFNEIRRNAGIVQCDSCQRILFFAGESQAPVAQP